MNLEKLFQMQTVLDKRIEKEHPKQEGEERFAKKVLALIVELGELANEWRGFKFWSNDQEPRAFGPNPNDVCKECNGQPIFYEDNDSSKKMIGQCDHCDGCGVHFHNPLLEEYVDCLHFLLSICIDLNEKDMERNHFQFTTIEEHFIYISALTSDLLFGESASSKSIIHILFPAFIEIGEMLGFTWEQIEQAYISKNEVNHSRQENGY